MSVPATETPEAVAAQFRNDGVFLLLNNLKIMYRRYKDHTPNPIMLDKQFSILTRYLQCKSTELLVKDFVVNTFDYWEKLLNVDDETNKDYFRSNVHIIFAGTLVSQKTIDKFKAFCLTEGAIDIFLIRNNLSATIAIAYKYAMLPSVFPEWADELRPKLESARPLINRTLDWLDMVAEQEARKKAAERAARS